MEQNADEEIGTLVDNVTAVENVSPAGEKPNYEVTVEEN